MRGASPPAVDSCAVSLGGDNNILQPDQKEIVRRESRKLVIISARHALSL
jgi:hypothetical protein